MNQKEFIENIRITVANSAVDSVIMTLTNVPGRQPSPRLIKLSDWYNKLSHDEKKMLLEVVQETVDTTVFGFLCILDGIRTFEDSADKGVLKLIYEKQNVNTLLNDPDEDFLHDLW